MTPNNVEVGMMMQTTARAWFTKSEQFETLCRQAHIESEKYHDEHFALQMLNNAKRTGLDTPLTNQQMLLLCNLAYWNKMPKLEKPCKS